MGGACCGSVPESFRVEKIHSVVLGGTRWFSVVFSMSPQYSDHVFDALPVTPSMLRCEMHFIMVYMSPEIMQFRQLCNSLGNCAIPGLLQIP
jgi:hypothetical protein